MRAYAVVMVTSLYHQKNGCSVLFSVRKAEKKRRKQRTCRFYWLQGRCVSSCRQIVEPKNHKGVDQLKDLTQQIDFYQSG